MDLLENAIKPKMPTTVKGSHDKILELGSHIDRKMVHFVNIFVHVPDCLYCSKNVKMCAF